MSRRGVALGLGGAAVVAVALALWWGTGSSAPRRTVVLVILDTVRPDVLPPWGADREVAPWLAGRADRGVVFTEAVSTSSWTAPSTASVFTGRYPPDHGVVEGFRAQHRAAGEEVDLQAETTIVLQGLPSDLKTLPERLQDAGWQTLGVASNVNIGSEIGFDRGFDRFFSDRNASAGKLSRRIARWVGQSDRSDPLFVYLHLNDAHHPYRPQEPYYTPGADETADELARYRSEIRVLDDQLAELSRELGWDDHATFVIASDHGEAFGEHGDQRHIFSLYGEVNRVALLVSGRELSTTRVETPVSLIDVAPTVLDLAGLPPDPDAAGRSLLPLARGEAAAERVLFGHRTSPRKDQVLWSAQRGRWKLLDTLGTDGHSYELYDLAADPGELDDRAATEPDVLEALSSELVGFQTRHRAPLGGSEVELELDAELHEHLEALGYVGDE